MTTEQIMIKHAHPEHPIHELISKRWSPYGFDHRPVRGEDLRALFEAARWAPSSYNAQPWRFIVARRGERGFERILGCLLEGNQAWARHAPVLALGLVRSRFVHNDQPNAAAEHDLGLAAAHLSFEATARGISVHQMIGIQSARIREEFSVPDDFRPLTAMAIGYPGAAAELGEALRARDATARERRTLEQFVFGDNWEQSAAFLD
jgi:nitroreductase